jgi:hypothetical protein
LIWSAYREFDGGVQEYEIYRSIDGGSSFNYAGSTDDTAFVDDIKPFSTSKGKFCYYMRAIAEDGIIPWRDEFGDEVQCTFERACAVHKARLWVPSAFQPKF